jgi:hypothetical protein
MVTRQLKKTTKSIQETSEMSGTDHDPEQNA